MLHDFEENGTPWLSLQGSRLFPLGFLYRSRSPSALSLQLFFLGGFRTKIGCRKKVGALILPTLLEDLAVRCLALGSTRGKFGSARGPREQFYPGAERGAGLAHLHDAALPLGVGTRNSEVFEVVAVVAGWGEGWGVWGGLWLWGVWGSSGRLSRGFGGLRAALVCSEINSLLRVSSLTSSKRRHVLTGSALEGTAFPQRFGAEKLFPTSLMSGVFGNADSHSRRRNGQSPTCSKGCL